MRGLLWQINYVWLGITIAFCQVFFPAGEGGFGQMVYRSPEGHPRTTGMAFFGTVPGPHFLGVRVCQGLWDSSPYLGKLHWFLYLLLFYFYDPGMFIFRWRSNFVENVALKARMAAKIASQASYLVYYYCI